MALVLTLPLLPSGPDGRPNPNKQSQAHAFYLLLEWILRQAFASDRFCRQALGHGGLAVGSS